MAEGEGATDGEGEGAIDGEGVAEGEVLLDYVSCPEGSLWSSPPDLNLISNPVPPLSSDFANVDEEIVSVRWWVIADSPSEVCTNLPSFEITFFYFLSDTPGGDFLESFEVTPTITFTGATSAGGFVYALDASLPGRITVPTGNGRVVISPASDFCGNARLASTETSLSFCLVGEVEDPIVRLRRLVREVQTFFNAADSNQDSALSFEEVLPYVPDLTHDDFELFDASGDGLVRVFELLTPGVRDRLVSLDINGDRVVSLSELLRLVQLYNAGSFGCDLGTEDGYAPGAGNASCCVPAGTVIICCSVPITTCRAPDVVVAPEANQVTLSDLLRGIQLFSFDGYSSCIGSEIGFCPGI